MDPKRDTGVAIHVRERRAGYAVPGAWPRPRGGEPLHVLAGACLFGLRTVCRARARISSAEARFLSCLLEGRAHRKRGFSSFGDFVREILQLSPRTARRRVALHRAMEAAPPLRLAFETGALSSCQVLALAPVVTKSNAAFWIELAANVTVRELARRAAEAERGPPCAPAKIPLDDASQADGKSPEDDADAGKQVTFATPMSGAVTWDAGIEAARRTLGWDAPVYEAVTAILAEAEGELSKLCVERMPALDDAAGAGRSRGQGRAEHPRPAATSSRSWPATVDVQDTGEATHRIMQRPSPPADAGRLRTVNTRTERRATPRHSRAVRQTLALLEQELAGLEESIDSAVEGADDLVNRLRSLQLAERPLRLLEARLLRDLDASGALEAIGFENLAAFVERYLGLSERTTRARLAETWLFDDEPLLSRAFAEGRIGAGAAFLIRRVMLNRTLPAWIRRAEQVTHLQLAREVRLVERLWECAPDLAARYPGPLPQPGLEHALAKLAGREGEPCPVLAADPARDPRALARLETLLDAYALETGSDDPAGTEGEGPEGNRQTLAAGRADRMTTISFWAPESVHATWNRALDRLRARWGPLPTWAASVILVEHALGEWLRVDPSRRLREGPVLERDRYHCQAPGCSSRRNLEVHHIVFRSRGGVDEPWNKITLCHAHHRRGIHEGTVHLSGRAPGALTWELGGLQFEGQRYARRRSRESHPT